jgi:hypothetical protein
MNRRTRALVGVAVLAGMFCGCGGSKETTSIKASAKPEGQKTRTVSARGVASNSVSPPAKAVEAAKKPVADPAWLKDIRLQGIGGQPGRRLAIINGKTLGPGDAIQVKTGPKMTVILRCVAVNPTSATVSIEGIEAERELRLN